MCERHATQENLVPYMSVSACHVALARWVVSLAWLFRKDIGGMSMSKGLANTDLRAAEQLRNTRKSDLGNFAQGRPTTNYVITSFF